MLLLLQRLLENVCQKFTQALRKLYVREHLYQKNPGHASEKTLKQSLLVRISQGNQRTVAETD